MKYASLVEYCVRKLVENPDMVAVEEVPDGNATQVQVRVAQEDTGKVIGRSGRLVSALRQVVNVAAAKNNDTVYVKVMTE